MKAGQDHGAPYRGEGDNTASGSRDRAEFIRARSDNFWRSVYKRIEGSKPHRDASPDIDETLPRPPRDYVDEAENRIST